MIRNSGRAQEFRDELASGVRQPIGAGSLESKEPHVNTIHDLDATTYAPTSHAPRGEECTVASAWSSSPLGDPAGDAAYSDAAGFVDDGYDFAPDPTTSARKPRFNSKGVLAGSLIAAVGLSAALGMTLFGNSNQPRPVSVASGVTAAPVAAPAAAPAPAPTPPNNGAAPASVVALPADIPAPAPAVTPPVNIPAPAPVVTPPPDNGPPPADPGPPPAAPPPGPVVIVNSPPPPVWLPPIHPPLPLQPPSPPQSPPHLPPPPKLPTLPPPPSLCLPPHHLVQGVCK